ncbi:MAG TPA: phosphocholine cytidylyltransferase family protein [Solirubrobacteraceae bacterium]|jgi:choline kinase
MEALILAAGRGTRLGLDCPKCLVDVGGRPVIHHQLEALYGAGVERVVVVAGYQIRRVRRALPADAVVVPNRLYAETNSLYSFWLARGEVGDEVLVLNSDVLFPALLADLLARWQGSALAYDSSSGDDEEHMKVAVRSGALEAMSKSLPAGRTAGENVGSIRLSGEATASAFAAAHRLVAAGRSRDWLASAIERAAGAHRFQCLDVAGLPWVEIDFPEDLAYARETVAPAIERLEAVAAA